MKIDSLENLFVVLLSDIYFIENELVNVLPQLAKKAQSNELKEGIRKHLEETKQQVVRLEECFRILGVEPRRVEWNIALHSLFDKTGGVIQQNTPSAALDSAIIVIAQRVEHYEIATYGSLIEFCKCLDQHEIKKLLDETLKEEYNADKALTKAAEGGIFAKGINEKAIAAVF